MPYQKRYNNRRRRRRRAPARNGGYLGTASKALAVAYAVKKLINVEYKVIRSGFVVDPSSTGSVTNFTAIPQGDDLDERDGNKVRAKYIKISGVITLNASATNSRVRIALIRDNNGSTTQPAITDLYSLASGFANNTVKTSTPQNNSRFTVLYDRLFIMDAGHGLTQSFTWSSSLDHHIFFTGAVATDEGKGHIYCFQASNEATNDPVVAATVNVMFLDN